MQLKQFIHDGYQIQQLDWGQTPRIRQINFNDPHVNRTLQEQPRLLAHPLSKMTQRLLLHHLTMVKETTPIANERVTYRILSPQGKIIATDLPQNELFIYLKENM